MTQQSTQVVLHGMDIKSLFFSLVSIFKQLTLHEETVASIPDKTGLVHHDHEMVRDHTHHPSKRPKNR